MSSAGRKVLMYEGGMNPAEPGWGEAVARWEIEGRRLRSAGAIIGTECDPTMRDVKPPGPAPSHVRCPGAWPDRSGKSEAFSCECPCHAEIGDGSVIDG